MTTAPQPGTDPETDSAPEAAPVPVEQPKVLATNGHPDPATAPRGAAATIRSAAAGALNFLTLTARIAALTTAALHLKEQMHAQIRDTEANAEKVRAVAEMCDAAGVEPQFTALILESSTALRRVPEAARDVAETADRTELHARQFGDAHEAEYRGIHEAVNASGVQQPKAGFNAVR
jgi:hypothetical protein